jgi:hypothetical protein
LTRSEFIARADKICRRINAKRESFKIASKSDLASVVPVLAAYEQAAVAEMRKLTPPASIARGWNQILEGADRLANATAELGEAAKANKIQQTGTLSKEAEKANEQVLVVSKREGIMDCAQRKA